MDVFSDKVAVSFGLDVFPMLPVLNNGSEGLGQVRLQLDFFAPLREFPLYDLSAFIPLSPE
jgi:hypothetical protein